MPLYVYQTAFTFLACIFPKLRHYMFLQLRALRFSQTPFPVFFSLHWETHDVVGSPVLSDVNDLNGRQIRFDAVK